MERKRKVLARAGLTFGLSLVYFLMPARAEARMTNGLCAEICVPECMELDPRGIQAGCQNIPECGSTAYGLCTDELNCPDDSYSIQCYTSGES